MEQRIYRTKKIERWGFAMFMAGQGAVSAFVGLYLQMYLTDIGLAATAVGLLFLVSRVWDAVNDPLFGIILDKVHLKGGKFIPFLRASNILLPIATIVLFAIPSGMGMGAKLVWAFVTYLLFDVAYTISDVPVFAMTSATTDQVHERTDIMSRNTVLSSVAMIIVLVLVPQFYTTIGALGCALAVGAAAAILMGFMSKFAKERYVNKDEEQVSFKQMYEYIKSNKYMQIGFLGILVLSITNMTNAVVNYFAINCMGDLGMSSILTVMLVLPSLVVAVFMPALTRRFDKFTLLMVGIIGQTVMCVVCYFVGYANTAAFLVCMLIRCTFYGFQLVLQIQLTGDFVEYGEYITGKRLQGIAYATQTFVFKLMNALPGSIAMIILGMFGFVSGEGAVQPQIAIDTIWVLFMLSPVVGAMISLPIFAKYKLRDKTVQIMAAANSGDLGREEADKLLEGKL